MKVGKVQNTDFSNEEKHIKLKKNYFNAQYDPVSGSDLAIRQQYKPIQLKPIFSKKIFEEIYLQITSCMQLTDLYPA